MRLPLALAAASPERTLSRISSRSNSALLAKMPKTSRAGTVFGDGGVAARERTWLGGCDRDSAPSDSASEESFSRGENPGATRRRLRRPGSSGFSGLRTQSGIHRESGRQCGIEAQGRVGDETGPSGVGDLGPNRACLWRMPVRYPQDLAVETTGHL